MCECEDADGINGFTSRMPLVRGGGRWKMGLAGGTVELRTLLLLPGVSYLCGSPSSSAGHTQDESDLPKDMELCGYKPVPLQVRNINISLGCFYLAFGHSDTELVVSMRMYPCGRCMTLV